MRQKNSDGAEVVWNDPEEGHIPRPPSAAAGKLHLLVEIYGKLWQDSTCTHRLCIQSRITPIR